VGLAKGHRRTDSSSECAELIFVRLSKRGWRTVFEGAPLEQVVGFSRPIYAAQTSLLRWGGQSQAHTHEQTLQERVSGLPAQNWLSHRWHQRASESVRVAQRRRRRRLAQFLQPSLRMRLQALVAIELAGHLQSSPQVSRQSQAVAVCMPVQLRWPTFP